jgi:hypothetical protein
MYFFTIITEQGQASSSQKFSTSGVLCVYQLIEVEKGGQCWDGKDGLPVSEGFYSVYVSRTVHTVKKRLAIFPSPAGMSLTKLSLDGKILLLPPGRVWLVTSRLGTGESLTFFYSGMSLHGKYKYDLSCNLLDSRETFSISKSLNG